MLGLIFKKTFVWHLVNVLSKIVNLVVTAAMLGGITVVTYTIYIVTNTHQLLSIPAMAILACAIMLLVRDEVAGTFDETIWTNLYCVVLCGCITGKYKYESGWLILDVQSPRSSVSKFVNNFAGRRQPRRVLRIISDENEELYIGWDMRPIYSSGEGIVKSPNGKRYRFSKLLF